MKRKNWKRTAAFVTSLTMATTMMPAELASVIVSAAPANGVNVPAETGLFNWADTKYDNSSKSYITSIMVGGTTQTNLISNDFMRVVAGNKVTVTSSVPLNFIYRAAGGGLEENQFSLNFGTFAEELGLFKDGATFYKGENPLDENKEEVSPESVLAEIFVAAGYSLDDKTFTTKWDAGKNNVIVTFKANEKVENGKYTYTFTMPDDNKSGTEELVTAKISAESFKVNFYKSEEDRTDDAQSGALVWSSDTNGDKCDEYFGATLDGDNNVVDAGLKISASNFDVAEYDKDAESGIKFNDNVDVPALTSKIVVGDTVTVTAKNPFVVYVSDGDDEKEWIKATNTFEDNSYKAVFTMPAKAANDKQVIVDIVKIEETYSYKANGNKLLATSTNTNAINNVEAAKIVAKYYDSADVANDATYGFGKDKDKGKEITGTLKHGEVVVVGVEREGKLTAVKQPGNPFKVSKNGEVVTAEDALKYVGDGTAGTYTATYTVKGTDDRTYELSYSFRIAAKDELTCEDVKLTLSAKENNVPVADDILTTIMATNEKEKAAGTIKDGEVVTFMLAKGQAEKIAESGKGNSKYQFTVDPTIFTAITEGVYNTPLDAESYYVTGYTSGSTLSKEYEFTIHVTDPEYGGSVKNPKEFSIKWKVVSFDEIPQWNDKRFDKINPANDFEISIDDLEEFEEKLSEATGANEAAIDAVEKDKVRYQWIKAPGARRTKEIQDELDEWESDLPSELGDYTVYIIYDDVVQATVDVHITLYSLGIFADEADLTFTYGHKFELTKPTVQKSADGKVLDVEIDDLKCKIYKAVEEENEETGIKSWVIDAWDEKNDVAIPPVIAEHVVENGVDVYNPVSIEEVGQLNAGKYIIEFTGDALDEEYSVKKTRQLLTVNPKNVDDSSIVILIDPFDFDGAPKDVVKDRADNKSNFTVRDTDFAADDPRYDISDLFKITEGGKQSSVGAHDCTFTLVSSVDKYGVDAAVAAAEAGNYDNGNVENLIAAAEANPFNLATFKARVQAIIGDTPVAAGDSDAVKVLKNARDVASAAALNDISFTLDSRTAILDNFDGSIKESEWHITAEEANDAYAAQNITFNAGLKWDDVNTTLYDNGKIHLEITRNANDKIRSDKKVANIVKFGVIVDKEGKITAPATYSKPDGSNPYTAPEIETAEKFLQYGNGFTEGGYTKTSTPVNCDSQTYKVNIAVEDVETGVWARPYVLYDDGTVSYGDVKYVDLTNEAINRLKLWTANATAGKKAVRKADLDKYQTANEDLIKANVKSGYNTAENKFYVYSRYVDLETAGFTNVAQVADFGIVVDRTGVIDAGAVKAAEKANVAYNMDYSKEYAKKSLKIGASKEFVVGHYKKDNAVLKENEYAASIKLGNSATGCWVRSYIDLGNGLVIYNEPIYIESPSEFYGENAAGTFKTEWEVKDANTKRLVFTHNQNAASRIETFATKAGIKNPKNVEVVKTGVVADKNNLLVSANKMILNAGFINGVQSKNFNEAYSAKLTPKDTNDVSVRSYTTYKIKGADKDIEVTVYGPVMTFEFDATKNPGRVCDNGADFDNWE